jgi:phosphate/phosphite/phosphonate ABC transporter binding protein
MPREFVVAIPPAAGRTLMEERVAPLATYLRESLKIPVVMRAQEDYGGYKSLFEAVEKKQVQAAILSPLAYVEFRKTLPVIPVASASGGGSPAYVGYLVVRGDAPYRTLESLMGKRVAWVDRVSASGYLYPRAMLRWRGFDPNTFFSSELFLGNHLAAAQAVVLGEVDVAALASMWVDQGNDMRFAEADKLRVIAKTSQIPLDCVVIRKDLPRSLAYRFRSALLDFDRHRQLSQQLIDAWGIGGFVPVDDRRYDTIERVLKAESAAKIGGLKENR